MSSEFKAAVDEYVSENKVIAFIKGSKDFPQCGFSNTVVQARPLLTVPPLLSVNARDLQN